MIQSLNENSLIQPFHIAMTHQDFEDFEKNAVSNFEEIEKNRTKNFEEAEIGPLQMFEAALDVPAESLMYLQTKYNIQTARKDSSLKQALKEIRKKIQKPPMFLAIPGIVSKLK